MVIDLILGPRSEILIDGLAEKQTVEFNLNVRAQFKKTVRARMGE